MIKLCIIKGSQPNSCYPSGICKKTNKKTKFFNTADVDKSAKQKQLKQQRLVVCKGLKFYKFIV